MEEVSTTQETKKDWRILRVEVGGNWSAREWEALMGSIAGIYELKVEHDLPVTESRHSKKHTGLSAGELQVIHYYFPDATEDEIEKINEFVNWNEGTNSPPDYRRKLLMDAVKKFLVPRYMLKSNSTLQVRSIEYASPGNADLLGLGEIIKQVVQIIKNLCPKWFSDERRAEQRHAQELELKAIEIETKREELKKKRIENIRASLKLRSDLASEDAYAYLEKIAWLIDQGKITDIMSFPDGEEPGPWYDLMDQ